jgi:CHC2 zinc finger
MIHITLEQALSNGHGQWRSFTCPKHDDTNPSARVNVSTGRWVCMSCHAKGDVKGYVADPIMELDYAMSLLEELDLVKPESWLDQFDSGPAVPVPRGGMSYLPSGLGRDDGQALLPDPGHGRTASGSGSAEHR